MKAMELNKCNNVIEKILDRLKELEDNTISVTFFKANDKKLLDTIKVKVELDHYRQNRFCKFRLDRTIDNDMTGEVTGCLLSSKEVAFINDYIVKSYGDSDIKCLSVDMVLNNLTN